MSISSRPQQRTQGGATSPSTNRPQRSTKPEWKKVAIPSEHGGWSLTLEPVVLGLIASWSIAGLLVGIATLLVFLARTPLKVVLVDRWRDRWLPRTALAAKFAAAELSVVIASMAAAIALADDFGFLAPAAFALPLVAIELWFDMRSKSRRLLPELAGAIGIGAAATVIALAGGLGTKVAYGLWLLVAGRACAALPFVRTQLDRAAQRPVSLVPRDVAQAAVLFVCAVGASQHMVPWAGVVAIGVMAVADWVMVRRPPQRAVLIGAQQSVIGLVVVLADGIAVHSL